MTRQVFDVHVECVNEGANKEAAFDTKAIAISVSADGQLKIDGGEGRSQTLGATTWGSVTITRLPRT